VDAAEIFTIEAKIDLTKLPDTEKLKVIAFANGKFDIKFIDNIQDMKSKSISVPFTFQVTNAIVTLGHNDEYFVCAYAIKTKTGDMKSYSCYEGDIEKKDGKNKAKLDLFQTVKEAGDSNVKDVIINVLVPLSDRKNVKNIRVVAMDKGEFQSKEINAADLLKNSNGETVKFSFNFDRKTEIGQIEKEDLYFACVIANKLNPPEGTECEHKSTKKIGRINNLYAS
jgi:hypothetical protein